MKHDRPKATDVEPHVFDQTNGVIDPGPDEPDRTPAGGPDRRSIAGIAMLSTQRP